MSQDRLLSSLNCSVVVCLVKRGTLLSWKFQLGNFQFVLHSKNIMCIVQGLSKLYFANVSALICLREAQVLWTKPRLSKSARQSDPEPKMIWQRLLRIYVGIFWWACHPFALKLLSHKGANWRRRKQVYDGLSITHGKCYDPCRLRYQCAPFLGYVVYVYVRNTYTKWCITKMVYVRTIFAYIRLWNISSLPICHFKEKSNRQAQ